MNSKEYFKKRINAVNGLGFKKVKLDEPNDVGSTGYVVFFSTSDDYNFKSDVYKTLRSAQKEYSNIQKKYNNLTNIKLVRIEDIRQIIKEKKWS